MIFVEFIIRKYQDDDATAVAEVGTLSWVHTYSHIYGEDYIEEKTEKSYSPDRIRRSAKETEYSCMFVADFGGSVIGFAQPCYYNYWDPDTFDMNRMMLARIYLHPDYMRKGVGSRLLGRSEQWIRNHGFVEYDLFVHKDNELGMSFYKKMGFVQVKPPNNDGEILLRKKIT